jgi:F0F1-type ATP synthase membrane subunit b/b'
VEVLEEILDDAMQAARAVGGEYYAQSATRLTELQAQAHAVLDQQKYDEFPNILAQMKSIAEHAVRRE